MTAKHLMIAINWYGPYASLDEARASAVLDYVDGLYLCIGRKARERKKSMQYIGLGKTVHTRLVDTHHKLSIVTREKEIWLGEIATAEPSGRRLKATKTTLDLAEWLHARFLRLPLNDKKTKSLPNRSVTVLNRWFNTDYATPRGRRPHAEWPDLLDFPAYDMPARLVWFGSRQRLLLPPHYARV